MESIVDHKEYTKSLVLNNNNYFDFTSLYQKGINPIKKKQTLKTKQNKTEPKKTVTVSCCSLVLNIMKL